MLREVTGKIELERIDIQKGIMVEALLDSRAIGLVIVKIVDGGLHLFLFSLFHFIFLCLLIPICYF